MTPKNQGKNLDVSKLSDDDLQDRFTEVFDKRVGAYNNLNSFECNCKRDMNSQEVFMEVTVIGMAGSPVMDDFKNMKVRNADVIALDYEGRGTIRFKLLPEKIVSLNTNDYLVVYKSL